MSHRREQGNIVGYVLVGAFLAALVVGGIYVVRNYIAGTEGTIASNEEASPGEETPNKPETNKDTNSDELKEALEQQAAEEQKAQEQQADKAEPAPTETPVAESDGAAPNNDTGNLPATGPEEVYTPLVGAMLMTATTVAYIRSRGLI
ncbi:hypothetical protein EOL96_03925 [Candidatus Saccharibacteria bacterium]|nr:hypothetical protein [Candidatus Saccharibacteria bacterium]